MVYVVGHRGVAGLMPENTIKGFRHAIALGVDAVECDVHLSRDKQLVVMHDSTVDRTTNGRGAIQDLTAARLRSLDAGQGELVPTLDEVLESVRHEVHLLIELKGLGVERAAVDAVKAHGMIDEVTFSSFALDRLAVVRAMGKNYRVRAILPNPNEFELARAVELKAVGIDVRYSNVCLRVVEAAHALGLEVLAWNPDSWREQQAMIALGVDGVSSNRPDILLESLGRVVVNTPEPELVAEPAADDRTYALMLFADRPQLLYSINPEHVESEDFEIDEYGHGNAQEEDALSDSDETISEDIDPTE